MNPQRLPPNTASTPNTNPQNLNNNNQQQTQYPFQEMNFSLDNQGAINLAGANNNISVKIPLFSSIFLNFLLFLDNEPAFTVQLASKKPKFHMFAPAKAISSSSSFPSRITRSKEHPILKLHVAVILFPRKR